MDSLTVFGFISVTFMLIFYSLEQRSVWFVLGFAVSCMMASIYGFLQGTYPFAFLEAIWSVVAIRRWWVRLKRTA